MIIQAGDKIVGINRKGLTIALPDSIARSASEIGLPFTVDGEAIGNTFHAFDLLELNGVSYRACPFKERYEMLVALIPTGVGSIELVAVGRTAAKKRADFFRLKSVNAEGVVFKRVNAPYTPGRPASGGPQLKFKFVTTGTFIVAGVNAGKRSVGLEVLNASGQAQYVGNVTVPANHKVPKVGALMPPGDFRLKPVRQSFQNFGRALTLSLLLWVARWRAIKAAPSAREQKVSDLKRVNFRSQRVSGGPFQFVSAVPKVY